MNTPTSYKLTFKSQPHPIDADARLQRLLKCALRSFGFRCVNIETIEPSVTATVTKGDTRKTAAAKRRTKRASKII